MTSNDGEDLDVRRQNDETRRREHDECLEVPEADRRRPITGRYGDVEDGIDGPADARRVGDDDDDAVGQPDDGQDDVLRAVRQYITVRQRFDDDEALDGRHRRQMPDSTEDGRVSDAADDRADPARNGRRLNPGEGGVRGLADDGAEEIRHAERQHQLRNEVLARPGVPCKEHGDRSVDGDGADQIQEVNDTLDVVKQRRHGSEKGD